MNNDAINLTLIANLVKQAQANKYLLPGAALGAGIGGIGLPLVDYLVNGRKKNIVSNALLGAALGGGAGLGVGHVMERGGGDFSTGLGNIGKTWADPDKDETIGGISQDQLHKAQVMPATSAIDAAGVAGANMLGTGIVGWLGKAPRVFRNIASAPIVVGQYFHAARTGMNDWYRNNPNRDWLTGLSNLLGYGPQPGVDPTKGDYVPTGSDPYRRPVAPAGKGEAWWSRK